MDLAAWKSFLEALPLMVWCGGFNDEEARVPDGRWVLQLSLPLLPIN
jgi:hypothetical protein